jgi:hypothetical protein
MTTLRQRQGRSFKTIDLPIRVKSCNAFSRGRGWKGHHFGYIKPVRQCVCLAVRGLVGKQVPPLVVRLTRIAPRALDVDNLISGMKPVRDGVTDGLGLADDSEKTGLTWEYAQMRGVAREYGLRIEIRGG